MPCVGVLALQGAFIEHLAKFEALGVPAVQVSHTATHPARSALLSSGACWSLVAGAHGARAGTLRCPGDPRRRVDRDDADCPAHGHGECDGSVGMGEDRDAGRVPLRSQWEPLVAWMAARKPTWGTCAGLILMADAIASGGALGGQATLVRVHDGLRWLTRCRM